MAVKKTTSTKGKFKILIAEDERPLSKVMHLKLTSLGYDAVQAFDGQEAMDKIDEGGFSLYILDLVMPKKDGFEVLEHIKAKGDKTPAIILSNLSQTEDKTKALSLGAVDFFIKSDTPISQIVEYIHNLLNK